MPFAPPPGDDYQTRMGKNLLDKVWELHSVRELESGQTQLFIGLHLVHEVTSPQAFSMIREAGLGVPFPDLTSFRPGPSNPSRRRRAR